MEINLEKGFLGEVPVKVHRTAFREETSHGINSINGYCRHRSALLTNAPLNIVEFACIGIGGGKSIEMSKTHYYPVDVQTCIELLPRTNKGQKSAFSRNNSAYVWDNVVFINGLSRPNTEHVLNKFIQILKDEYPNTPHIETGRYVFCMDHLAPFYVNILLDIAKRGDGSVIDYTWIAPFQDIMEYHDETKYKERLKKKELKKRLNSDRVGIVDLGEEDLLPLPIDKGKPRSFRISPEWYTTSGTSISYSTAAQSETELALRAERERRELARIERLQKLKDSLKKPTVSKEWMK